MGDNTHPGTDRAWKMRQGFKIALIVLAVVLVGGVAAPFFAMLLYGIDMVTNRVEKRNPVPGLPSDPGMPYEDVTVTTADGLKLVGWYVPSQNGAVVIAQHGYEGGGNIMLHDAATGRRPILAQRDSLWQAPPSS